MDNPIQPKDVPISYCPCYDTFIYRTVIWFVDFCNRYHDGMTGCLILHVVNEANETRDQWLNYEGRSTKPQPDPLAVAYYITPFEEKGETS